MWNIKQKIFKGKESLFGESNINSPFLHFPQIPQICDIRRVSHHYFH